MENSFEPTQAVCWIIGNRNYDFNVSGLESLDNVTENVETMKRCFQWLKQDNVKVTMDSRDEFI